MGRERLEEVALGGWQTAVVVSDEPDDEGAEGGSRSLWAGNAKRPFVKPNGRFNPTSQWTPSLQQQPQGGFQYIFERFHELGGFGTVGDAMVGGEGGFHADADGELVVDDDGDLAG